MSELTKGIDCSRWQGVMDWKKAAAQGVKFAFLKSSQNQFTDEQFAANWKGTKQEGILRAPYHFADYRYRAAPQAEYQHRVTAAAGGGSDLGYVLDVEPLWLPLPGASAMLAWIREYFEVGDALFGRPGILYTNPATLQGWLQLTKLPDWLIARPFWVAHYGVSSPAIKPFTRWTFWQYTAKGDGKAHGAGSLDLDMNWYNGSYADLLAFAGAGGGAPVPTPVELTTEEKVTRLWAAHPELWGKQ